MFGDLLENSKFALDYQQVTLKYVLKLHIPTIFL